MTRRLSTTRGGEVLLIAASEQHVTLQSDAASPPGSTLELSLLGAPLAVKVRNCRRDAAAHPARFIIEGRWISLSRAQRDALEIEVPHSQKD